VEEKFPGLRSKIKKYYTATPLSYRDYIGNSDGSMYGIVKDYKNPLKTLISPRTKLPNLYLTGQNLNLHGILGAAMSALVTCTSFLGNDDIIKKISGAVQIPVIANGGAGSIAHIEEAVKKGQASAVGLGSMVVYQKKGMGVLVNFPDKKELEKVLS